MREQELINLVCKRKKLIVLLFDEAHDLHHHTLTGIKRLIEIVADGDGRLLVLLAGHPKLRRDLRSPTMEEISYRTTVFSLEGVTGSQREYIEWMLTTCAADGVQVDDILDPAAVDLLAARLRTPLQIERHLTLALEAGYQASEKPVSETIVDSVLSKQIDDLEPTLTRHGYTPKVLTELLGTKPLGRSGRCSNRRSELINRERSRSRCSPPGCRCEPRTQKPVVSWPKPCPPSVAIRVGTRR